MLIFIINYVLYLLLTVLFSNDKTFDYNKNADMKRWLSVEMNKNGGGVRK